MAGLPSSFPEKNPWERKRAIALGGVQGWWEGVVSDFCWSWQTEAWGLIWRFTKLENVVFFIFWRLRSNSFFSQPAFVFLLFRKALLCMDLFFFFWSLYHSLPPWFPWAVHCYMPVHRSRQISLALAPKSASPKVKDAIPWWAVEWPPPVWGPVMPGS